MDDPKYPEISKIFIPLLLLLVISTCGGAQKNIEGIHGFIYDDKNTTIPGAKVALYSSDKIFIDYTLSMDDGSYYFHPEKGEYFIIVLCDGCTPRRSETFSFDGENATMMNFQLKKKEESLRDSVKNWWSGWGGFIGFLSAIIIFLVGRWLEGKFRKKKIISTIIIPLSVSVSPALSIFKGLKNNINQISNNQLDGKIDELRGYSKILKEQIEKSLMANELIAYLPKDEINGLMNAQDDFSKFLVLIMGKDKGPARQAIRDYFNRQYNPQRQIIENFDNSLEILFKYIKHAEKGVVSTCHS
ncbi:MAG: hypothetical protein A7315_07900 [Candidatus Altiarchaeales archaeon WOR_SM1_79]|nr:MAG: hypothetical protein A7315_07900 [Candidatus Altiarchaeales archaeon WOR_SM1_79]